MQAEPLYKINREESRQRAEALENLRGQLAEIHALEAKEREKYRAAKSRLDTLFDSRMEIEDAIDRLEES